jgi:hypothetical protein
MKSPLVLLLALTLPLLPARSQGEAPASEASSAEADARNSVLELAGAFSNDGYKIRDGFWFSELEPGASSVVQVNLFAGNEYWFCAAANPPASKISVTVYDESGAVIDQQEYRDGPRAAAGVVAGRSGPFFVKVTLVEGEKAPFCLLYCYK